MHIVSNNALESLQLCFVTFKLLYQHFMWNKMFRCHRFCPVFVLCLKQTLASNGQAPFTDTTL